MGVNGLAHIAIQARNYKDTLSFYTDVLGFKIGHSWSLPAFRITEACMLISPDQRTCIELFDPGAVIAAEGEPAASPEDVRYGALLHFALYVDNVDAIYEHALAYGAQPYVQPDWISLGEPPLQVRNAVVHSPNGEVIEFLEEVDFNRSASPST
ncbi:VOC family protein [Paenibacillus sp. MER 99-2]|uniref:VOC family protein n=1 Tax=Paenibacillus sp. MER 99-2 TaxID=2939572 RepID=UPI00203F6FDA|nr:VOC family protein [Paenibacillus sp. MER 99-2]MCM3173703.1 VOC family protein [Paenibacillus sp. MER 99-2]